MDSMVFSNEFPDILNASVKCVYCGYMCVCVCGSFSQRKIVRALHFALACYSFSYFMFWCCCCCCCFLFLFPVWCTEQQTNSRTNNSKPFQVKDPFKHISFLGQVLLVFLFCNRWLLHIFHTDIYREARKTIKKKNKNKKTKFSGIKIDCRIEYTHHR